ncbi:MAG: uracil-DNA glycosylase [Bacillota bacterium]|nr:uracil-DNA glycosylase [Bacillota bacterium]
MLDWEELKKACAACEKCSLCKTRKNVVFGVGNPKARIMFIGEGPGEQEDIKGEPFVGPAGHLLDDMLSAIGLTRDEVYIANIVKCRPPQNRDPQPSEQDMCIEWLRNQVFLVKPEILVCLGRIAACRIIDPEFKITKSHGLIFKRKGCVITSTFHPAALLRDPSKLENAFDDLKVIEAQYKMIKDA